MTLISWILVLGIAFLLGTGALRLLPVYLEYFKISSSLSSVQHEFAGRATSVQELRKALGARFDIESVRVISKDAVKIERRGGGYLLQAKYDHRTPFIGNVNFVVAFNKSVQLTP